MEISTYKTLISVAKDLDGVLTVKDLEVILHDRKNASFYRSIKELVEKGELVKIKRGIYALPDAELSNISARIFPKSYISTASSLARNTIIGSIPAKKIQAIKIGAPRIYKCKLGTIEFLSIAPKLFFGFEKFENCFWANPEKAFLDSCYFYYKGKKFSFNLESDINTEMLDASIINIYLKKYDKRFISFFKKTWGF